MGRVKIRYYVVRRGRGYWLATPAMQTAGFPSSVPCGLDGPGAWAKAEAWNAKWDSARLVCEPDQGPVYPPGSLGDAYERFRKTETWAAKAAATKREWEQAWPRLKETFGDIAPATISFEDVDLWYADLLARTTVDTAWRAMKIWRALWKVAAGMKLCTAEADPSQAIPRQTPPKRTLRWQEGQIVRLVKAAWRRKYYGLACIIAVTWDTQFSPGDVRKRVPRDIIRHVYPASDGRPPIMGPAFSIGRAKTGRPAIGTLSARTRRLLEAYREKLRAAGVELHPDAPLFRATDWQPYQTKEVLARAFARLRERVLPGDRRTLLDMRRSGAVEALAGEVAPGTLASKMANTIDQASDLQATYLPVDPAIVNAADEARRRGRRLIRNGSGPKVETQPPAELKQAVSDGA